MRGAARLPVLRFGARLKIPNVELFFFGLGFLRCNQAALLRVRALQAEIMAGSSERTITTAST